MIVALVAAATLLFGSIALVVVLARRHEWRWGEVPIEAVAGEGAYREGEVRGGRPRGAPVVVQWSAGVGFVWGILTIALFAPAGLLLSLAVSDRAEALAAGVLLVSLSGFALGPMTAASGISLLRCRPRAASRALAVSVWSMVHHTLVLAAVSAITVVDAMPSEILMFTGVACAIGAGHAIALLAASRVPEPAALNAYD